MHRTAIYTRLVAECPSFDDFYQPYFANADTVKPYGVIKMMPETPVIDNKAAAMMVVQVFVYTDPSTFSDIDDLVQEVYNALHEIDVETADSPPEIIRLSHINTSEDFEDKEREVIGRRVDFEMPCGV